MAAIGQTNQTSDSTNITSGASSLLLNLISAAGAIELTKLAQQQNVGVRGTGVPTNPVQVVPSQSANQLLQQNSTGLIILALAVGGVILAFSFKRR